MKGGFEGRFAPALFGAAVWVISSTEMISAISGRQVVSASRRQPAPAAKQLTLKSRALSFNETASHPRLCPSLTDEPSLIPRIALQRRRLVSNRAFVSSDPTTPPRLRSGNDRPCIL